MDIQKVLEQYRSGEIDLTTAEEKIRSMGFLAVSDIAKIDTFRCRRTGVPEAVLAEGKKTANLIQIVRAQVDANGRVLVTRVSKKKLKALKDEFDFVATGKNSTTCVVHDGKTERKADGGLVAFISAGTADISVLEEAKMTAEEMGCRTIEIYDVGVAGYHRLILEMNKLTDFKPDAVVVAAGREGTLPTVVAGMIDAPVIALPVSTGYGAGANGKAALLAMLQSCSVISVVNIDAGFVAGAYAARIANRMEKLRNKKSACTENDIDMDETDGKIVTHNCKKGRKNK
ncbi:Pyridinium-3,5-biscarboxylic acid mononucleotide synthase [Methanosarcinaceae archaeon Ag5]|uniref:Pyridinium-3,5-biscarboxylic acid mononucleotide synthase n=1 Tax=Methanolapillus africanus TaxID=3028297 RepID=A0AAE4MI61_9EURY|nr:Pyridinium-3,5-biscarboxylic acid mononucleotide synthase [Methanosarcinaceae archaeon Ag5]